MTKHFILLTAMLCGAGTAWAANGSDQGRFGTDAVSGVYLLDDYPGVNKLVAIGDFDLVVDRTHWSIEHPQNPDGDYLGGFRSHSVDISVSRAPAGSEKPPGDGVLSSYPVSTSHGVHGIKIVYGYRENFLVQNISAIRYIFKNRNGQTICFEAKGIAPNPNWYRANHLILDNLSNSRA